MDLIGFPTKGYSTLWGGIGYFEYYLKKLVVLPDGSTTVSFFCVEMKSQKRLAFLD